MKNINLLSMILFFLFLNEIAFSEKYLTSSTNVYTFYGSGVDMGSNAIDHWANHVKNWYLNEIGAGDGISIGDTETQVVAAHNTWSSSSVATTDLTFNYLGRTSTTWGEDGINTIFWAESGDRAYNPGNPFAIVPNAGAVTIVKVNSNYEFIEADILVNGQNKVWTTTTILWNQTHEVGHTIGLGDLPVDRPETMSIFCSDDPSTLTDDDIKGVSFLYGGNITEDHTLSYSTNYFNWPVNIINGVTLTVSSKTVRTNSNITVNGTLNATSTTFTSSGTWSGINFNSGSSGNINGCTINNVSTSGGAAVTINNSSPTIQSSTINNLSGTTIGISITGTGSPYILSNTITSSANHGIYVYNGTGYIRDNTINGYSASSKSVIYCDTYADGIFLPPGGGAVEGGNTIRNGVYGIYAHYHSSFSAGTQSTAHNNIFTNNSTHNVAATYYSDIMAENNYWDVEPPTKTYKDLTCTIDYTPYSLLKSSDTFANDNFITYKEIIDGNLSSDEAKKAVGKLWKLYKTEKNNEITNYIRTLVNNKSANNLCRATAMEVLSNIYMKENDVNGLLEVNESLIKEYPGTIHERNGILNKFYAYYNSGDYGKASESLSQIDKKYSEDDAILLANWYLKKDNNTEENTEFNSLSKATVTVPTEFELSNNYPNPFNPTTMINYAIPVKADVKIYIYDITGRLIKSFINNSQSAGYHQVGWSSTNENGIKVASGIYIYRMEAIPLEGKSQSFVQSKKMILLK